MNLPSPILVPILATPFGVVPLPDAEVLNPALLALISARMQADLKDGTRGADALCYRSGDDLLSWPEEPVRRLLDQIYGGVYRVVQAVNEFSEAQLNTFVPQARGWATIVQPNGAVPAHNHALTAWCAVYCVGAPARDATRPDSGLLRLYESRLGTMFADATTAGMRLPFRPGHYGWQPVPGHLAIFPGSLTHEIAPLRASEPLTLITLRMRFIAPGQQGVGRW
jgi:hypothetical protein